MDFWKTEGQNGEAWICPAAPFRGLKGNEPNNPNPGSGNKWVQGWGWFGTVDSSWSSMQTQGEVVDGIEKVSTTGRHGSYGVNSWLGSGRPEGFLSEPSVRSPATTPLISDCISLTQREQPPLETDLPPPDLVNGAMNGMGAFVIPRHGGRPSPVPTSHPASARLPGAINMSFYDGSVAHVQLEKLWQLTWHKNWVAPDRRPGR